MVPQGVKLSPDNRSVQRKYIEGFMLVIDPLVIGLLFPAFCVPYSLRNIHNGRMLLRKGERSKIIKSKRETGPYHFAGRCRSL